MTVLIDTLFKQYKKTARNPKIITFNGVEGYDVYNITSPFQFENKTIILGRVEKRDVEYSKVIFFEKKSDTVYQKMTEAIELDLQDPFYTVIDQKMIIGGVKIQEKPEKKDEFIWKTEFYELISTKQVKKVFSGPVGMKDLRLIQLNDGKIAIFTRPQGEKGGRGKIGFGLINSFYDLSVEVINILPLLDQFDDLEWGGSNALYLIDDEKIGVLGHIAKFDDMGNRHYYSMSFTINPYTNDYSEMKIICTKSELLDGPFKRVDLIDVIFSGGLSHQDDKTYLYLGVSDAFAQYVEINNPFK